MPMCLVLPFATLWVLGGDLLLEDGSSLEVCDQPCMQGAACGVGWRKPTALQAFQLVDENSARESAPSPWPYEKFDLSSFSHLQVVFEALRLGAAVPASICSVSTFHFPEKSRLLVGGTGLEAGAASVPAGLRCVRGGGATLIQYSLTSGVTLTLFSRLIPPAPPAPPPRGFRVRKTCP